jgi:hypothetical protein
MMFLGGPLDGSDIEVEPVEGVWYYYAPGSKQAHRYVLSERDAGDATLVKTMEPVMVYRGAEER